MLVDLNGKIAAILGPAKVVINRGSNDGVAIGDFFYIYSELGPFTDPDTNEDMGTTKQIWGKVQVRTVENRFCIAETESRFTNPFFNSIGLAGLFGTTIQKIRLPVNEGQIWKGLEKIEVGFPVLLEKRQVDDEEDEEPNTLDGPEQLLLNPPNKEEAE